MLGGADRMSETNSVSYLLEQLQEMQNRGEIFDNLDAPIGTSPGPDLWADAVLVEPMSRKPVHLRLHAEVYDRFFKQSGSMGPIKNMQQVPKAYLEAHE